MAFFLDCITYAITAVIVLSVFVEGKQTRYPRTFFYSSLVMVLLLIIVGSANWWFYHSFYGLAIAGLSTYGLLGTRFRMYVYALRFRVLVKELTAAVSAGSRVIMVLPDDDEQSQLLFQLLARQIPGGAIFRTNQAFGLSTMDLFDNLSRCNQSKAGYLLACQGQLQARTWLPHVENNAPDSSIAVNFHLLPQTQDPE